MKLRYWIFVLLYTVLFAPPSLADELPWYEVEIIVFTRDLHPDSLNEVWPVDPGSPDFGNAQPLQPELAAEIQPAETMNGLSIEESDATTPSIPEGGASGLPVPVGQRLPVPYTLIPKDEYRLKTEFKRLRLNNSLQPVVHLAWRQPVTDPKHAKLLYLQTTETSRNAKTISGFESFATTEEADLEGTIRVSVNRYLHVELDLLNRIKQTRRYSPYEQSFEDGLTQQPLVDNRYRMQARRRMRSGELHYIDHPLMGALVKITPYELPKPVPIVPVEPETIDKPATEQEAQAEGEAAATESSEKVTTEPEPTPALQEPGTTRSVIAIPAKREE
ncbi:CsiV family protein [Pseudomonadota bacterium]